MGPGAWAAALGDLNNDGRLDMAVSNRSANTLSLLRNDEAGFSELEVPTTLPPGDLAAGDLDSDGVLDLAVAQSGDFVLVILRTLDDFHGWDQYPTGRDPEDIDVCDVDADGDLDLVVASNSGIRVHSNQGLGSFAPAVGHFSQSVRSVAVGDLDASGHPDLAVGVLTANFVSVLQNQGNGSFHSPVSYPAWARGSVEMGDLDLDGDPDVVTTEYGLSLLMNRGDGSFADRVHHQVGIEVLSSALGDLDGDGAPEIVLASWDDIGKSLDLFRNAGHGDYLPWQSLRAHRNPSCVAIGDFDDDGNNDLAAVNSRSSDVTLLWNRPQ